MRKTISFLALTLLLTAGLAFAAEPAAAPAPAAPADSPVQLDLDEILGADSCAPQPQPASRYPGCSKTCKVDRDCPAYPDQVCAGGCCVY